MLEEYFVKPRTVDRIRGSWIGPQIEQYVTWLAGQGYGTRCVLRRVPLVTALGSSPRRTAPASSPTCQNTSAHSCPCGSASPAMPVAPRGTRSPRTSAARSSRCSRSSSRDIQAPGARAGRSRSASRSRGSSSTWSPSAGCARPRWSLTSITCAGSRTGSPGPGSPGSRNCRRRCSAPLPPSEAGLGLAKTSVREGCGVLRVFLRYARREGVISKDLTGAVEWPQAYRGAAVGDRGHRPRPPKPGPGRSRSRSPPRTSRSSPPGRRGRRSSRWSSPG